MLVGDKEILLIWEKEILQILGDNEILQVWFKEILSV